MSITDSPVSLVIFTCEGREHLLQQTLTSFRANCDFTFSRVILAVDGKISSALYDLIKPDIISQQYERSGYVSSISNAIKLIDTKFFFWLEDDWSFHSEVDLNFLLDNLISNASWSQIVLSKYGPLSSDIKSIPLGNNLYRNPFGFSANPCLCNTNFVDNAFNQIAFAPKGDVLGEDGFENILTKILASRNMFSIILDPVNKLAIDHEGYLETTPRSWHMTKSLSSTPNEYLPTIPKPNLFRRSLMVVKLARAFAILSLQQLVNVKVYELCFRIITTTKAVNNK